jgi:hypothetical protein
MGYLTPAFVLGLKSNFRGEGLVARLIDLKLNVRIVWGIEVDKFEKSYLNSLLDNRKSKYILGRRMSFGELSCAIGHLEMYEEFLLTNQEWGLFLEDDAIVGNDFDKVLKNLPAGLEATVLSLASAKDPRFEPQPFPFFESNLKIGEENVFRLCAIAPVLAHAYFMNRSGAIQATHSLRGRKIYSPADFPFEFRNHINFYVSDSGYVSTNDCPSMLDSSRLKEIGSHNLGKLHQKVKRNLRVIGDYSGLGVVFAKLLGLSARHYALERIKMRWEYKKFLKNSSIKYFR